VSTAHHKGGKSYEKHSNAVPFIFHLFFFCLFFFLATGKNMKMTVAGVVSPGTDPGGGASAFDPATASETGDHSADCAAAVAETVSETSAACAAQPCGAFPSRAFPAATLTVTAAAALTPTAPSSLLLPPTPERMRGSRRFTCPHDGCSAAFTHKSQLTVHLRVHTGEKPFRCPRPGCGRSFSQRSNLRTHRMTHADIKPFRCTHGNCGASFAQRVRLITHTRAHSGVRPFACAAAGCTSAFSRKIELRVHLERHHNVGPRASFALSGTRSHARTDDILLADMDATSGSMSASFSVKPHGLPTVALGGGLVSGPSFSALSSAAAHAPSSVPVGDATHPGQYYSLQIQQCRRRHQQLLVLLQLQHDHHMMLLQQHDHHMMLLRQYACPDVTATVDAAHSIFHPARQDRASQLAILEEMERAHTARAQQLSALRVQLMGELQGGGVTRQ
jgi:hypothetical protein